MWCDGQDLPVVHLDERDELRESGGGGMQRNWVWLFCDDDPDRVPESGSLEAAKNHSPFSGSFQRTAPSCRCNYDTQSYDVVQ